MEIHEDTIGTLFEDTTNRQNDLVLRSENGATCAVENWPCFRGLRKRLSIRL